MTEAEMQAHLAVAQDLLDGLKNQRDMHANESVQLAAQVKANQRALAEKDQRIAALEAEIKTLTELDDSASKSNGHDSDGQPAHAA